MKSEKASAQQEELKKGTANIKPRVPQATQYTIVAFGKTGSGKSSLLNKLMGKTLFQTSGEWKSQTKECQWELGTLGKSKATCLFVDTPGFSDSDGEDKKHCESIIESLKVITDGFTIFLYTFSLQNERYDNSEQVSMAILGRLCGRDVYKQTRLICTQANKLDPEYRQAQLHKIETTFFDQLTEKGIDIPRKYTLFGSKGYDKELEALIDEILAQKVKTRPAILNMLQDGIDLTDPIAMLNQYMIYAEQNKVYCHKLSESEQQVKQLTEVFANERKKYITDITSKNEELNRVSNQLISARYDASKAQSDLRYLEGRSEGYKGEIDILGKAKATSACVYEATIEALRKERDQKEEIIRGCNSKIGVYANRVKGLEDTIEDMKKKANCTIF